MKKEIIVGIIASFLNMNLYSQKSFSQDKNHGRVSFSVMHLGISHIEGNFKNFDATLISMKEDLTDAVINFRAEVNSINTDVEYRDNDLKSAHFFDSEQYPFIDFKSTSFKKIKGNNYKLHGSITIHGITKDIILDVVYNGIGINFMKKQSVGFTITGRINRSDFKVGSAPFDMGVGEEINLKANIEFIIGS